MKQIRLTQGKVALVDDADFEWLSKRKWHAVRHPSGRTFYAGTGAPRVFMHTEILGKFEGKHPDHKDGNGLNNQRSNLRPATPSQNGANRRKQLKPSSSRFKGVTWHKRDRVWQVSIMVGGKAIFVGTFHSETEAAKEYNRRARFIFGHFANLNEIP